MLVLDDVTPLIRAQRVAAWRDVARRLAHEIKNPLTPIQLSAERLRRHFAGAAPPTRALVDECTGAIVTEVEALKGLVDEFAQFARLRGAAHAARRSQPAHRRHAAALRRRAAAGHAACSSAQLDARLPPVRLDAEQIRQVIINLVDNAIEALGGPTAPARPDGRAADDPASRRRSMPRNGVVRLVVTDNGPGVPPADRDKLFMPYYSTKGRGSGLGSRDRAAHRRGARRRHRSGRCAADRHDLHGRVTGRERPAAGVADVLHPHHRRRSRRARVARRRAARRGLRASTRSRAGKRASSR